MILSQQEAADMLRLEDPESYPQLNIILPAINEYLKNATGYDWGADTEIDPVAKQAATMLLVLWFENPAMIGAVPEMEYGITNLVSQLQAKVLPEVEEQ